MSYDVLQPTHYLHAHTLLLILSVRKCLTNWYMRAMTDMQFQNVEYSWTMCPTPEYNIPAAWGYPLCPSHPCPWWDAEGLPQARNTLGSMLRQLRLKYRQNIALSKKCKRSIDGSSERLECYMYCTWWQGQSLILGELKVVLIYICALWDAITVKYMTISELVLKVIRRQTPSLTGTL